MSFEIFFTIRAAKLATPIYSVKVKLPSGEECEVLEDENQFIAGSSIFDSPNLYAWLRPMFQQDDPDDPYKYQEPYAVFQVILDEED